MSKFWLVLILLFVPWLARAEGEQKSVWLLMGPEAYHSSLFRNSDWSMRPELEMHIELGSGFSAIGFVNYYEFKFLADSLNRIDFGPGVAYDLIPQRLRLSARMYISNTDYFNFRGASTLGVGLRAQYFVPVGDPWRIFLALGWDAIRHMTLRRDTSFNANNGRCLFFCYFPEQDEKNHIYQTVEVPGSHEFSGGVGAAYSFH